ncbi:MAG: DUF2634 domain-containing protein [Lachnospiraceae bacterium]|nr:DUF2634 domain-containing protein [Lachnospiraceae bacterium]
MLPKGTGIMVPVLLKEAERPSRTFGLDLENGRIRGTVDGLEAVRQAVYCILNTERYDFLIYSWNYGTELKELVGRTIPYVKTELKRRIREALLQDERIKSVDGFQFVLTGRSLAAQFTVHTTFGDLQSEKEMMI